MLIDFDGTTTLDALENMFDGWNKLSVPEKIIQASNLEIKIIKSLVLEEMKRIVPKEDEPEESEDELPTNSDGWSELPF